MLILIQAVSGGNRAQYSPLFKPHNLGHSPLLQPHSNLVIRYHWGDPPGSIWEVKTLPAQHKVCRAIGDDLGVSTKRKYKVWPLNCKWRRVSALAYCLGPLLTYVFRGSVCPLSPEAAPHLHCHFLCCHLEDGLTTPDICLISSPLCHTLANWTLPHRGVCGFRDVDHPRWHNSHVSFLLTSWQKIYLPNLVLLRERE